MTIEEALAEVHRHFCANDGTHDDACVALARRDAEVERRIARIEAVLAEPVMSEWALRYWRDAATRPKVAVTLEDYRDRIRAALLTSEHSEACHAPPGNLCTETGCWDMDRCVIRSEVSA
jgi:hypothetical protein